MMQGAEHLLQKNETCRPHQKPFLPRNESKKWQKKTREKYDKKVQIPIQ